MVARTFWIFGLPCSGKTTLAKEIIPFIEKEFGEVVFLDGDSFRKKHCPDLGFSNEDRALNNTRAAAQAQLLNRQGKTVVCCFISPTRAIRKTVASMIDNIVWIFADCSLETCKKRDVKGMYAKAEAGEIKEFTGVSSPFERPYATWPCSIVNTEKYQSGVSAGFLLYELGFGDDGDNCREGFRTPLQAEEKEE